MVRKTWMLEGHCAHLHFYACYFSLVTKFLQRLNQPLRWNTTFSCPQSRAQCHAVGLSVMTHGHPASCRVSMQTSECLRDVGDELGTVSRLENNNRGEKKPSQGASKPVPETGGNQWSAFHRYLCTALCAALTPLNWCQLSDEGAKVATGPGPALG